MTSRKNRSKPNDTGYYLSKDRMSPSIRIITTTIVADSRIKLGNSVP